MESTTFRHEALIYHDDEAFLAATVPFLRDAVEAAEPAMVAVGPQNTALLEAALGSDAGEVRFAHIRRFGRNPARIIPFWRQFVDEFGGRSVRGIGEPVWPGRRPTEIEECRRHEHLLNVAFSAAPSWSLLCPFDGRALDEDVLRAVSGSHSAVDDDGVRLPSADFEVGGDQFTGELDRPPGAAAELDFDIVGLAEVRRTVDGAAHEAGLAGQRGTDLVLAASELATNSVVHGGGVGTLRVWREGERVVVEVEDRGRIAAPLAGRMQPRPMALGGRGLWLVNELCDLVQIRSGPAGTKVRLHMSPA